MIAGNLVRAKLAETLVTYSKVVGKFVSYGDPQLILEALRVCAAKPLKRAAIERDPAGPAGVPDRLLRERGAFVRGKPVLPRRWLRLDHEVEIRDLAAELDWDLIEGAPNRPLQLRLKRGPRRHSSDSSNTSVASLTYAPVLTPDHLRAV